MTLAVSDFSVLLPDDTDADFLFFLPLATWDENGELEGRLATSWEHSDDYREWTYHLRTDVRRWWVYRELTRIFRAEWPATFLSPHVGTVFAHRRLQGLSNPWRADPVWFMEDLWIEDED